MSGSKAVRLFVVFIFLLLVQAALATSSIVGFVTVQGPDAPAVPIPNAIVNVTDAKFTKQILAVGQTNAQGFYSISGLAPGNYQVTFTSPNFLQGILSSFTLSDKTTVQINAHLVPVLTSTEVAKNNVKDETAFTIHNPNNFNVNLVWSLPNHHATGTGTAFPGDTVIETNQWPHSENMTLFVDGVQVQKVTTTVVGSPTSVGNLSGFVRDSSHVLGGVSITLTDSGGNQVGSTFSLADGSYVFTNIPAASYTLSYSLTNYIPASQSFSQPAGGAQAPLMVLAPVPPAPTATVGVTVSDPSGPVTNASVQITYSDSTQVNGPTDGNGFVSFSKQPVSLAATITTTTNDGSNRSASITTSGFVPGSNSVNVQLPPIPRGTINGQVTDGQNNLGGVLVSLLDANGNSVKTTNTLSDGTYVFGGVAPATYTLTFSKQFYATATDGGVIVSSGATTTVNQVLVSTTVTVTVNVTDGDTDAPYQGTGLTTITFADGSATGKIPGGANGQTIIPNQEKNVGATVNFVSGDGRTASAAYPTGFSTDTTVNLTLPFHAATLAGQVTDSTTGLPVANASIDLSDSVHSVDYKTTSDGNGNYSIGNIQPTSTMNFLVNATGFVTSTGTFAVSPGENGVQNFPMVPNSATVTVNVVDGGTLQPITSGTVTILYVNTKTTSLPIAPDGTSIFSGQDLNIGATATAVDGMGRTASATTNGWVPGPNSITVVLPALPQFGIVQGQVTDLTTKAPIQEATVTLTDAVTKQTTVTNTDSFGNYSFNQVSPSKYTIDAVANGYMDSSVGGVPVTAGSTVTQNFALTPSGGVATASVSVLVLDAGRPSFTSTVQIFYNDKSQTNGLLTDLSGHVTFTGQETGVSGTVTATSTDGRKASVAFSGWTAGSNSITINLPAPQNGSIQGLVIDGSTGMSLAGVSILIEPQNGLPITLITSKMGTFSASVPAGSYDVTLQLSGYQTMTINNVVVASGTPNNLGTIKLSPNVQPKLATVTVTVLDALTNAPVPNASVTIAYTPGVAGIPTLLTDGNGIATFTNQPVGVEYVVNASTADGRTGSTTPNAAGFNTGPNAVTLFLNPAALSTLTGTVIDGSNKKDLAGVSIVATDNQNNVLSQTTSFVDGTFTLSGLPATGTFNVTFSLAGYVTQTIQESGNTNVTEFLQPQSTNNATVNVTVMDGNSNPLSGASVDISYSDGSPDATGVTDGNGFISFSNQPVGVQATVSAQSKDGSLAASRTTAFSSGVNPVSLTLVAIPGSISGQVVDATTSTGLPFAQVSVVDWNGNPVVTVNTDSNGNYEIDGLVAGSYAVTYSVGGYSSQTITIPVSAGKNSTVNVQLDPDTASPSIGILLPSGNGAIGAQVTITYADGTKATGSSQKGGLTQFANQPVGLSATITCVDNAFSGTLAVPGGFPVGKSSYTIQIEPSPTTIVGTVTDLVTGQPISGATVNAVDPSGAQLGQATTASDGTYRITGVHADTANVTFSATNYLSFTDNGVETLAGQTVTASGQLTPIATVSVTVLDPTGAPVANASVDLVFPNGASTAVQHTGANGQTTFTNVLADQALTVHVLAQNPATGKPVTAYSPMTTVIGPNSVTVTVPISGVGNLSGNVTDQNNVALAGVLVQVMDVNNNTIASQQTDASGNYSLTNIPTGTYTISFCRSGYQPVSDPNVVISTGNTTTQNATLSPTANPMDATLTIVGNDSTSGNGAAGFASVTITYADGSVVNGQLDGNGNLQLTNQLVGVRATVQMTTSDGRTSPSQLFLNGFTSGPNSITFNF